MKKKGRNRICQSPEKEENKLYEEMVTKRLNEVCDENGYVDIKTFYELVKEFFAEESGSLDEELAKEFGNIEDTENDMNNLDELDNKEETFEDIFGYEGINNNIEH